MQDIEGVILAGGRATRMQGRDKGLVTLNAIPLYQQVLQRLAPQVSRVVISANRNQQTYRQSGCEVLSDSMADFPGPLAGVLTALEQCRTPWLISVPCDVPFIPTDLVNVLWQGKGDALLAYIDDGEHRHPTLALWHRSLLPQLRTFLQRGERKLMLFMQWVDAQPVRYANPALFININSLQECQQAQ
ncbi:molybdenum cofactor guanylyltransferase MobA [Edwardsiella piscicida]|uniref:Molybdenum cofactor guanylyltransferase n=4 Tax=Edwardsiella TaxID=635 RepID=A0A0H3DXJ5_EDWTF|nr:molybdenum cofactor guanylyltransferase MobA [Edwardsiella piscicida]ACY86338.1 molybdopterin-guanine dinucleotide biosynthesis protein A [Edwardsiella tarda EIB202]ADM43271.1 Molybdopterin-guanine dinucleotide biosynthesis protein A [Edwardsiella tarda FL6-60]ARD18320.1 molybdenum cofactor guanylyltransferase [Edwardsiella piscicida]MDM3866305.1 molybdenum cofactor guanylyltransferase MobA [Edwardsiella piscicida]QBB12404.1 molybdenum cofactor guanylyltransferase MobA [Edwardsiella piscici